MKGTTKLALVIVFLLSLSALLAYNSQDAYAICPADTSGCSPCLVGTLACSGSACVCDIGLGTIGSGTCNPACAAGKTCANGYCYANYTSPAGGQTCTSDSQCTSIGPGWICREDWEICVKDPDYMKSGTDNVDPGLEHRMGLDFEDYDEDPPNPNADSSDCDACEGFLGDNKNCDEPCLRCIYKYDTGSADKITESGAADIPFLKTSVDANNWDCVYSVNITKARWDDRGEFCAGACGTPFYQSSGSKSGDYTFTEAERDKTKEFVSAGSTAAGFKVTDVCSVNNKNQISRHISAEYATTVLNPTAIQKCVLKEGQTKPQLAPKCAGTRSSCIVSPGDECFDCSALDGGVPSGAPKTSCQGTNMVTIQTYIYTSFDCTDKRTDPELGAWLTCAPSATGSSQTVTSSVSCKYGCSNGKCNTGKPPVLSSISVKPTQGGFNDIYNVSSVASDPDTITGTGLTTGAAPDGGGGTCDPNGGGGITPPAGCTIIPDDPSCGTGGCFRCPPGVYSGQVYAAVNTVANSGASFMESPTKVRAGQRQAYYEAIVAILRPQGFNVCASCTNYEELAIRRPSDNFEEGYNLLTSGNLVRKFHAGKCPVGSTPGLATSEPTFDLITPTLEITGDVVTGGAAATTGGRKEKIRLECGTAPSGTGGGGPAAVPCQDQRPDSGCWGATCSGSGPNACVKSQPGSWAYSEYWSYHDLYVAPDGKKYLFYPGGRFAGAAGKTLDPTTWAWKTAPSDWCANADQNPLPSASPPTTNRNEIWKKVIETGSRYCPDGTLVGYDATQSSCADQMKKYFSCLANANMTSGGGSGSLSAVCKGGTTPKVELKWVKAAGAIQNTIQKREFPSGSFTEISSDLSITSLIDSSVQLGKSYVYRYKPDPNTAITQHINVTLENCNAPAPTGSAVSDPTFTIAYAPLPITGMVCDSRSGCTGVCDQFETNKNPAVRLGVKVYHYECPDGTSNNNGPIKVGCDVTMDSTPHDASGKATNAQTSLTWACTGPFALGRDTCFIPRGKVTGEGPITCTGTLGTGITGSVTFAAGNGLGGSPGGGAAPLPTQNIKFTADLCSGELAEKDPKCTIKKLPGAWASGGEKTIYCRAKDESGLYSDVKSAKITIDVTPPSSVIVEPGENSVQRSTFVLKVTDSDDTALNKCYYIVNGVEKERTCNADVTIGVGAGRECSEHGTCTVAVYADDKFGNKGTPFARRFAIKFIFTNITSPRDGSYQSRNFTLTVEDRNFQPANVTNMTCTYDVFNVSSSANPVKTTDKAQRNCSMDFAVSVGPRGDCNLMGQGACKVVSRISGKLTNGTVIEDTSERFYSIDWITPSSRIVTKPAGWIKGNTSTLLALFVEDDPAGSNITECQYKVASNGTETVGWRSRPCGAVGNPAELKISVGPGGDCRHEGGHACVVFVRPLDKAGLPGFGDNATLAVTFEDVDVDGFSVINALTTRKGINFTGRTRQELRAATFYVCNAESTVSSCIDSFNIEERGVGFANYCGSIMLGGQGKCELRCNDMNADYYFAARGQPLTGPIRTATVISPLQTTPCPVFRIEEINAYLALFRELEEMLNVQIMMTRLFIEQHGEDDVSNNETLEILKEALLLTTDHINYMENAMLDLDVDKANEIIRRSEEKLDEINALLLGITQPTSVRLYVNMPAIARYNTTSEIPAYINTSGPSKAYAKTYCALTKPGGIVVRNSTTCLELENGQTNLDMKFSADTIGTWTYSCVLGRSTRSDCSFEINSTSISGAFQVLPGLSAYIESLSVPATVIKGRPAIVTASVKNPDDVTKYANVRCDFIDPQNFLRKNTSACATINPGATSNTDISMMTDRLGNWTAEKCTVSASSFANCQSLTLDNVSLESRKFEVKLPEDVYIESLTLPRSPVLNDSTVQVSAAVQNPTASAAYVILSCTIERPSSPPQKLTFEGRKGIEARSGTDFTFDVYADTLGLWNVDKCTAKKSTNPDYSNPVQTYMLENLGSFDVIKGTDLRITSFTIPSQAASGANAALNFMVKNPSNTRYGKVSCNYRTPQNTPLTTSSACVQIDEDATVSLSASLFVSSQGLWLIESCSALASISDDCSSPTTHDTISPVGSFVSTGGVGTQTVELLDVIIDAVDAAPNAFTNSRTNAIVSVRNINPVNTTYAHVNCAFTDPTGVSTRQTSACYQVNPQSTVVFGAPHTLNSPGTWTVSGCYVNASSANDCALSRTHNTSSQIRTIQVTTAADLYVKSVDAPDALIVNNSDVQINILVENPLSDDKFGTTTCTIKNPAGTTTTRTTPCISMPRQSTKNQNVTVFANMVGTWIVDSCTVKSSTNSACTGGATTGELKNGDVFNVIRGYNLIFSSMQVDQPVYMGTNARVPWTVNNPSSSERFARVRCTASKGGQSITNSTACFAIAPEAFFSSVTTLLPNSLGTWDITCAVERSTESSCASPVEDHSLTRTISVDNAPDLNIQNINIPGTVRTKKPFDTIITVKNPGLLKVYGFVGCTYKNFLNETQTNTSTCTDMTRDTNTAIIKFTPSYRGAWEASGCFVNAGNSSDCTSTRRHNLSLETKNFISSIPLLSIDDISLSATNLLIGDVIDISVAVSNNDEISHVGFVNCSIISPNSVLYRLTTPNQTLQADEIKVFHPKRVVDVAGTWRLVSCSVFRINSPPFLEDTSSLNQSFNVTIPSEDQCSSSAQCATGKVCQSGRCIDDPNACTISNCPGIKEACYCSGNRCMPCADGYICQNGQCISQTFVNTCKSNTDCPSGLLCIGGECREKPAECILTSDCPSGLECINDKCTAPPPGLPQDIVNLLIIILSAISIPVILFIYIKRVI